MVNTRVGMMGLVCSGSIIGDAQTEVIGQSHKVTGTGQSPGILAEGRMNTHVKEVKREQCGGHLGRGKLHPGNMQVASKAKGCHHCSSDLLPFLSPGWSPGMQVMNSQMFS